ncbi:MAG TPA: hypothetical protein VGK54_13935 [Chloroflexota bacterium]
MAVGTFAMNAEAVVTYQLNNVFSGSTPAGAAPWATATFQSAGANTVTLTLTNNAGSGQFITEWDFNSSVTSGLTFTYVAGSSTKPAATGVQLGSNCCQADGDGLYDIEFDFAAAQASRFTAGTVVYTITGTGITEGTFNELSAPAGGAGPFHTAAHLQGIPGTVAGVTCSGWISDTVAGSTNGTTNGPCTTVAEPSVLLFSGLGLAFVGGLWRRMRTRPA